MNWIDINNGKEVTEPKKDTIGFVYYIIFTDNTRYIGKKNFYVRREMPMLKSNKVRPNVIDRVMKNKKGKREYYDVVVYESNWKRYKGSAKDCKHKEIRNKYILAYAKTKLELTYLEAKYLFNYEVLEDDSFINDNILGRFYGKALYGLKSNNSEV